MKTITKIEQLNNEDRIKIKMNRPTFPQGLGGPMYNEKVELNGTWEKNPDHLHGCFNADKLHMGWVQFLIISNANIEDCCVEVIS